MRLLKSALQWAAKRANPFPEANAQYRDLIVIRGGQGGICLLTTCLSAFAAF